MYTGELISLGVAVSWTVTALCFEFAGKRIGALSLNILRLGMAILMLGFTLYYFTGYFFPRNASGEAWFWLGMSGFIGYVFGDYCLFNSYLVIGARFGQLFMTLAPPFAAIAGYFVLGETLHGLALPGMVVTMSGIGMSIIGKPVKREDSKSKWAFTLPFKGILLGIGAGIGQGVGLVFSKLGMDYYVGGLPVNDTMPSFLISFASTQIRALVGITGFLAMLFLAKKGPLLIKSFSNRKAMMGVASGAFFGPFIGVSFSLMAVQYTEAGIASTLMALTPILILLPSYFIFHQKVTMKEVVGAIISVIGVSLFFIPT